MEWSISPTAKRGRFAGIALRLLGRDGASPRQTATATPAWWPDRRPADAKINRFTRQRMRGAIFFGFFVLGSFGAHMAVLGSRVHAIGVKTVEAGDAPSRSITCLSIRLFGPRRFGGEFVDRWKKPA